ncbi:MAG: hypothetical protein DHS20C14_05200 [Phycisphaeraceae bacterium]|nr:MAG: hypothetical protein DHS20C14_05200 [Phycisphaeraceae bacterium]
MGETGQSEGADRAAGARLDRVRGYRVRPEGGGLGEAIDRARRAVRKRTDAEQAAAEAWEAVVPDEFRERATFVSVRRGVVTVRVPDAGVRYRLEAWVRGGGQATYAGVAKTAVSRVKVVV